MDAILFKLHDVLTLHERGRVKDLLRAVRQGSGIYQEELHKALLKLHAEFKISEAGRQAVMEAVFGEN